MLVFLSVPLFLILIALGLLHFYWAAGGTLALDGAMPLAMQEQVNKSERQLGFRILTLLVGLGLVLAGGTALSYLTGGLPAFAQPFRPWFVIIMGSLFALRAVGDFSTCGLFAPKKEDLFSVRDRTIYTPLCQLLAALWAGLYWVAG